MFLLYSFLIRLLLLLLRLAAPFSKKIKTYLQVRKNWREQLKAVPLDGKCNIWIHCASLGEFEQGKPVMEALRATYPEARLFITFFSPSGYEARKDSALAHYTGYLPADTFSNALDFVTLVKPRLVVFVKSEIWPNYIRAAKAKRIPLFLISARFYPSQVYFKWWGGFFRDQLKRFDFIFVQDPESRKLLKKAEIYSVLAGDTRFDRVLQTKQTIQPLHLIEKFTQQTKTLVVGSCWPQDLEVLLPFIEENNKAVRIILAPHEVEEQMILSVSKQLKVPFLLYSDLAHASEQQLAETKVLIMNCIGLLAATYQYAQVAFVGGAFKQGLHNILEPAVFGIPVVFGPEIKGFPEAAEMISAGGGFSVKTTEEVSSLLTRFFNLDQIREQAGARNLDFVQSATGATEKIAANARVVLANKAGC